MTQQNDPKGNLRVAFTTREFKNAKYSIQGRTADVFIRVALAVIFMYLILISHQALGTIGPVFVSTLFLVAYFAPFLYQVIKQLLDKRTAHGEDHIIVAKTGQES